MKFLITGSDGLLGNNLVRELLADGHEVRVFLHPHSDASSLSGLPIDRYYGDVTSDLAELDLASQGCDGIFHCAAITDILAPRELMYAVNVAGTENVIAASLKNKVRRLVFVGSASSFQFGEMEAPGDEQGGFASSYRGVSYMESKHDAMKLVQKYVREKALDAVVIVPTFMLGSYDTRPSSGELIRQHMKRNPRITTMGGRNFVHVRDVARGMILAFEKGRRGESYILGGRNLSYVQFFGMVNRMTGRKTRQYALPQAFIMLAGMLSQSLQKFTKKKSLFNLQTAKLATLNAYYTPNKALTELGMPQTPIETAIQDALKGLEENGHLL